MLAKYGVVLFPLRTIQMKLRTIDKHANFHLLFLYQFLTFDPLLNCVMLQKNCQFVTTETHYLVKWNDRFSIMHVYPRTLLDNMALKHQAEGVVEAHTDILY